MTINQREFFNSKPRVIEYMTLELYHPAFGSLRYVRDQFVEKTLGGLVYQPASMIVKESVADDRATVSYDVQLGRVGTQVKEFIKAVNEYPFGWMVPVRSTVQYFLSRDLTTPYRTPVTLDVGTIGMDADTVAITLETGNPRSKSVAIRYSTDIFKGLRTLI